VNIIVKREATQHGGKQLKHEGSSRMAIKEQQRTPTHPGDFVRSEIIDRLGISITDAAQALGVTRPALSKLLNARAHLSPEMALRIEKAFGLSMDVLMKLQNAFDIAEARQKEKQIKVVPFIRKTPLHQTRSA